MSLKIVILAAGAGTRMKSKMPKVLHKICGKEMLFYSIKEALKVSKDVSVVLGNSYDEVKNFIDKNFENIDVIKQDIKNYPGTAGALMNLKVEDGKRVIILNGDMPLITSDTIKRFDISCDVGVGVFRLENPKGYGRIVLKNGVLEKIVEEKDASEEIKKIDLVNSGLYVANSTVLKDFLKNVDNNNAQREFYLPDIIYFNKKAKVVEIDKEDCVGVNSKKELADAENLMLGKIREAFMLQGVTMRMPETIYIESTVKIEGSVILENGVTLLGDSYIKDTHIKSHSVIEDSTIVGGDLGPFARIRPGSDLKDTHIGNFVEVKKSKMKNAKAGHLSYIGDSEVLEGVNIGAGVITANYDGVNKHKTKIDKNSFIGSNSVLVAPINVGKDVLVGAGSVISRDVDDGSLVLTRAKLKESKNYK